MTKIILEGKEFILLIIPDHSLSLREGKTGAQGRNLKASLLAIPHNITSNQGTHFTGREGTAEATKNVVCWAYVRCFFCSSGSPA